MKAAQASSLGHYKWFCPQAHPLQTLPTFIRRACSSWGTRMLGSVVRGAYAVRGAAPFERSVHLRLSTVYA